ncbi:MAG: hypothetical protein F2534_12810 [Actinobacteria bacterium]|uniref:Unannotated protein n=1 Tax=freshwater metagenome TaxID=449393 RepID=A0A6J6E874_9ZZZZ|nr:hypothetical protein [Actinomycetota bacterium]
MPVLVAGALLAGACSGGDDDASPTTAAPATTEAAPGTDAPDGTATATTESPTPSTAPPDRPADSALMNAIDAALSLAPEGCDPLDTRHCLLPFPSNGYRRDGRVALPAGGMPANVDGVPIDPTEWNRNDGFSPSTPILVHLPDVDPAILPPWTDLEASLADDAPIVLIDTATGDRVPLWAELDASADSDDDRLLMIRPAVSLTEGVTYALGLRDLVTASGDPIEAEPVFVAYRDRRTTDIAAIEDRRDAMEATFDALAAAGVERDSLVLAWDFTVATAEDIAGRMLHIRDTALAELGDAAPPFTITSVTPGEEGSGIARQVVGTYTVPNFLTGDGGPGNRFSYGDGVVATGDELPQQNGTLEAPFVCNISDATLAGGEPAHLVQYGHGLLGSEREIGAGNVRAFANEHNVVFCATKWAGMSEDDIGNAVATLTEFSNFPTMADRLQQGVLNQIVLGRLMTADDGLASDPAFQADDGSPLVDTAHLDYDGNSQGGIMGQMLAAVSPDIERAVLGVTGMNYSMLLERSVDFDTYATIMQPAYPNDLDRVLIIALVQMLWDRGEGAGYVHHVVDDPYPGTPAKELLLHVAFGDWQVTELSAMVAARTMGVPIHRPVTAEGRSGEVVPGWGLDAIEYPSDGSGLVIWDSGSDPIPFDNVPPRTSRDSHEDPRADADVRRQKAAFLFDDTLIDVCDGAACTADARD